MPEQDNTYIPKPKIPYKIPRIYKIELDLLWDRDLVEYYKNLLNFYNTNFWGYGVSGQLTNLDPRTLQEAILSNFNYARNNIKNFSENLLIPAVTSQAVLTYRWVVTPVEIGSGTEAIVSSTPLSTTVTKVTTIPRTEMHLRNGIPGVLKSRFKGTKDRMNVYTQSKVKILSKDLILKVSNKIEKLMLNKGWKRISHPNLDGLGFTNGRFVVSDLGEGNIGMDFLGRPRLADFVVETVPLFRISMLKRGGILK